MKIAYLTDSGTGLCMEELAKDGILSVPLQITDGTSTWQDLETMSYADCIHMLEDQCTLTTSQPSPGLLDELFAKLKENGTDLVVAVPICPGLSGTMSTMSAMALDAGLKFMGVDTFTTAYVQNYLIHRIKLALEQNTSDLELQLMINSVIDSCDTILIPGDLMQLARNGRLTPGAAHFANLLRIVPILHLNKDTHGKIDIVEKVLTRRKAYSRILSYMQERKIDSQYRILIAHTNAIDTAETLYHMILDAFPEASIDIINMVNPVSAQAGIGTVAVQFYKQV